MSPPFPGMDPWLENPAHWPDFHNSLIAAIGHGIGERLARRYVARLQNRVYRLWPADQAAIGIVDFSQARHLSSRGEDGVRVLDVDIPEADRVTDWYLEIRTAGARRRLVTIIELLSPGNKLHARGRRAYLRKRDRILESSTHLVEIDLMRAGDPMPWIGPPSDADYRVLVSRAPARPRALVHAFNVRSPIPNIPIPLLPPDEDVPLDLNTIVHTTYNRARYDLSLDYTKPPVPPLNEPDTTWAAAIAGHGSA